MTRLDPWFKSPPPLSGDVDLGLDPAEDAPVQSSQWREQFLKPSTQFHIAIPRATAMPTDRVPGVLESVRDLSAGSACGQMPHTLFLQHVARLELSVLVTVEPSSD